MGSHSFQVKAPDLIALDSPFISEQNISREPSIESLEVAHQASVDLAPDVDAMTPLSRSAHVPFDSAWKTMDASKTARGWCELPMEEVVWRLQGLKLRMDVIPMGDLPFPSALFRLSGVINSHYGLS